MSGGISAPDPLSRQLAEQRQAQLIKPRGALGRLEDLACWFAARQQCEIPAALQPGISVFAADHGVARRGVSAYPQSVTAAMLSSLVNGQAAIAVLARELDALYDVVDVGVAGDTTPNAVHRHRIASGTQDLSISAAMTTAQAIRAMDIGAEQAKRQIQQRANLLIAGDIGIGNTTASACLIAALTGIDAALIVGAGTGLDQQGKQHKLAIVRQALARVGIQHDPLQLLSELGGFEIGAMAGFYLQAARSGVPILLDGFISTAAALLACKFQPAAREWMLASHQSAELGHALALEHLQLHPLLNLQMRLGEGSGAALAVPLIQSALRLHREMATFAEAGVASG